MSWVLDKVVYKEGMTNQASCMPEDGFIVQSTGCGALIILRLIWQGWPRGGLSRAASTGAVDEATTARTEFGAVRSKSMVRFWGRV